jgi:hypothetical protein
MSLIAVHEVLRRVRPKSIVEWASLDFRLFPCERSKWEVYGAQIFFLLSGFLP